MEHKEVNAKTFMQGTAAAGVLAFVLAGCSATEEAVAPEPEETTTETETTEEETSTESILGAPEGLAVDGVVSFCIDPEYPPMEYYEEGTGGEILGFDADMQRAIAAEWGVELEFVVTAFDGLMPGLQAERCDILMSGLYLSEARLEVADGSPYFNAGAALVARAGEEDQFQTQMDICGKEMIAQGGSANSQIIRDLGPVCEEAGMEAPVLTEYPRVTETVFALINGRGDALIETNVGAAYIASENVELETARPDIFPPDIQFGIYTRPGSPLTDAIRATLPVLVEKGIMQEIAERYGLAPEDINITG